ncbi:DUF808 domain-containing protein [bacterium]|nr:MAG: DUF808 domain-containing protein [bacterium]
MASGLAALLDDVAALARAAAVSMDDIAVASGKAGTKAVGIIVDDAAVTPRYVQNIAPARELPMIGRIAFGSLRNKLLILLPIALLLGAFAPWAISPILMAGGTYLAFEGAEKVLEAVGLGHGHGEDAEESKDPTQLEEARVKSAVRTDLILSAEIMAITFADVASRPLVMQALVLAVVGVLITALVYGVVGLIVKMDDVGLHLAERPSPGLRTIGRGLVKGMLPLMRVLATVGTAAMLWVGGGIVAHGLEGYGVGIIPGLLHGAEELGARALPFYEGRFGTWFGGALASAVFGLLLGGAVVLVLGLVQRLRPKRA